MPACIDQDFCYAGSHFDEKELFDEMLQSVKQGGAIMKRAAKPSRTFTFAVSEVRKIRDHYGLSQEKFAMLMGISSATLRNWEQCRRKPEGPARNTAPSGGNASGRLARSCEQQKNQKKS